ncbi:hypothetical protein NEOC65_001405 [Neochlamydia sp. AcF65]|nr:hypothetical protein [Neochlamydia sp. AcF65]MBS4171656.1 hypothetical protein [Neochlamydia sp. AcF95]
MTDKKAFCVIHSTISSCKVIIADSYILYSFFLALKDPCKSL